MNEIYRLHKQYKEFEKEKDTNIIDFRYFFAEQNIFIWDFLFLQKKRVNLLYLSNPSY